MARATLRMMAAGSLMGAATMFLLDPRLGAGRRALLRDKVGHYRRATGRQARAVAHFTAGRAHGLAHAVGRRSPWYEASPMPDQDAFVKQRVETAMGRERHLPLQGVIYDAVDGVVHVRGVVPDSLCAEEIVQRVAAVEGVRTAISLLHTPDGAAVLVQAGDTSALAAAPRAVLRGEALLRDLRHRWPSVTLADIDASDGSVNRLVELICEHSGEPATEVRVELDRLLLAAI